MRELEPGDGFLFDERSVPIRVVESGPFSDHVGSIYVRWRVVGQGPEGAELWLEETGTGRVRIKESAPYGAYANVHRLEKVRTMRRRERTETTTISVHDDRIDAFEREAAEMAGFERETTRIIDSYVRSDGELLLTFEGEPDTGDSRRQ